MAATVSIPFDNATKMNAYVSFPAGQGSFPGIIIFQEAFGVNNHIRNIADRLAAEGYVAIAPELFHRTAPPGFEGNYNDFGAIKEHFSAITTETIIEDANAAYNWLTTEGRVKKDVVACIGFCLGGRAAFIANSSLPLAASVSFYGSGTHLVADRAVTLSGPQLLFWGGKDTHIMPEHVNTVTDALKMANKDYISIVISYAQHAFFCDERPTFHPQAAREAWGMVREFLRNKLG